MYSEKMKIYFSLKSVSEVFLVLEQNNPDFNPFRTRQQNLKAKNLEKFPFLASFESLWTNQKCFPSHLNPPFNQGSYFDWFLFF